MFIEVSKAGEMACPQKIEDQVRAGMPVQWRCIGARCMAFRTVKTQAGERAYCGMAGTPPEVTEAMNKKLSEVLMTQWGNIAALLADGPGAVGGDGRIVLPG